MISKQKYYVPLFLIAILVFMAPVLSNANEQVMQRIQLEGGTVLNGQVTQEVNDTLIVKTKEGLEITVKKDSIVSIEPMDNNIELYSDPKSTRLLFSPTGRSLKKGKSYFTDFYVVLPGFSYGFTDRFSLMAGMSIVPGIGIDDQLKYIAPRYSFHDSENSASSVGFLNIFVNGGNSAGILFASHTIGKPNKSFTAALGWGYLKEESESLEIHKYPVIMLGGNVRLTDSIAFVTENWLLTSENIKYYPFVAGLRFFSKRIAVDVGAMFIGELIADGIPVPWLSFTYHFD